MVRERWRAVARVVKTHGRQGEVVTRSVHGLPPLLGEGAEVVPVPPALRSPRSRRVARCRDWDGDQLVSLAGVDGLSEATKLLGKTLLMRVRDLPEGWEVHDADASVGRMVVDTRLGVLGTVVEVRQGAAGDLWVVRGERGELLLPVVDAFVVGLDMGQDVVTTTVPIGLAPWDEG